MDFIRRPLAFQQNIPLTGGKLKWDFRKLDPRLGNAHLHVAGFVVKLNRDFKQAATTGAAIKGEDRAYFVKDVLLTRDPNHIMIPNVAGHLIQALAWAQNNGQQRDPLAADIAANGGGAAVSTQSSDEFVIWLEAADALEKDDYLMPLAGFVERGVLEVNFDNPTNFDSTITYDNAGSNTADVDVICVKRDVPTMGRDRRFYVVEQTGTGSVTGIEFPSGGIEWLIYQPAKVGNGGGDSVNTLVSSFKALQDQPYRIPDQSAKTYNNDFLRSCGFKTWADTKNMIVNGKMAVLIGQAGRKGATQQMLWAKQNFRVDVTISGGTLADKHRFLVVYVYQRDAADVKNIARNAGVDSAQLVAKPSSGRPHNTAQYPQRSRLSPLQIVGKAR